MRVISGSARGTILHSIDKISTRPTLDRVKESLFNIIQNSIEDATVLDLFSGSGAIAIEFLSRGAKKAYICEKSKDAVQMIYKNLEKTRLENGAVVYNIDYLECLKKLKNENIKLDIIFLDPPYKEDLAVKAIEQISNMDLLNENGIIIFETDEPERDINEIYGDKIKYKMYDLRKYGRASLIFLKERKQDGDIQFIRNNWRYVGK